MKILYVNAIVAPEASRSFMDGVQKGLGRSNYARSKSFELLNFDLFNGDKFMPWQMGAFARAHEVDGIILSGSEKNTTDLQDPWVREYFTALKDLLSLNEPDPMGPKVPVLGICFGHQALACTLGGETSRFSRRVDVLKVRALPQSYSHPVFKRILKDPKKGEQKSLDVVVTHSDQVIRMPQNFYPLFSSDYCEIQGMAHDLWPIVSLQSHPEITQSLKAIPVEARDWTHVEAEAMDNHHGPQILSEFLDWVVTR